MFSPFEQFEVIILRRVEYFGMDWSITNLLVFLLWSLVILWSLFNVLGTEMIYIPKPWQNLLEMIYLFLFNLVVSQGGSRARSFFPPLFTLFFLLLTFNLLGLLPFSFTLTAHIAITLSLSLTFFVAWIILGFLHLGLSFLAIFLPKNIPLWLAPLLVLVEILSFFLRPLSLAIRLFANMLAGHILLHIVGAAVIFLIHFFLLLSFLPLLFIAFVYVLEIGICFLQAYIFTVLLCIYLHDSLYIH